MLPDAIGNTRFSNIFKISFRHMGLEHFVCPQNMFVASFDYGVRKAERTPLRMRVCQTTFEGTQNFAQVVKNFQVGYDSRCLY